MPHSPGSQALDVVWQADIPLHREENEAPHSTLVGLIHSPVLTHVA